MSIDNPDVKEFFRIPKRYFNPEFIFWVLMLFFVSGAGFAGSTPEDPWKFVPPSPHHTDHATFYTKGFNDGPSVTKACLECHASVAEDFMKTAHWRWESEPVVVPGNSQPMRIGKKNLMNNFCLGIASNWSRCTQCHPGYGWADQNFDFNNKESIDCLICHDRTGTYSKDPDNSGHPYKEIDLMSVAKSVGNPRRENCGYCHFAGGGGDAVKHGDMDATMMNPSENIDIHMSRMGFQCTTCHLTRKHNIPGRLMSVSTDDANKIYCQNCHQGEFHSDGRLNTHMKTVACQTCHIPRIAVEEETKSFWDWSVAGDKEKEKQIGDPHKYLAIKGSFEYEKNIPPYYAWYNGKSDHYLLGEKIDPAVATRLAEPLGNVFDPDARIWPFKIHRGKQIYDKINQYFIIPKLVGKGGFWTEFDWNKAAQLGSDATGLPYSGEYGFAPTEMFWPINHMVQSKDKALSCHECHQNGRMNWNELGYLHDPMTGGGRKSQGLLKNQGKQ